MPYFWQLTSILKEKAEKILRTRQKRNRLLSRRNGKVQLANVKIGGEHKVTWSLLPFTFHVNAVLNISIPLRPSSPIGNIYKPDVVVDW